MALMEARKTEKVHHWTGGGGGAFAVPDGCRDVVAKACGGTLTAVDFLDRDVLVGNGSREFKIGIGDGALGIARGDQSRLHVGRKGSLP
jgi:hypothetical protein